MSVKIWYTSGTMSCINIQAQLSRVHLVKKEYSALSESLARKEISVGEYAKQQEVLHKKILEVELFFQLHTRERYQLSAILRDTLNLKRVGPFYDGFAIAINWRGEQYHIDKKGNAISNCIYEKVHNFKEGRAAVEIFRHDWGFINREGKYISQTRYNRVSDFSGGIAHVEDGFGHHFIKTDGTRLSDDNYEDVGKRKDGAFQAKKGGVWTTIVDPEVEVIRTQHEWPFKLPLEVDQDVFNCGLTIIRRDRWSYYVNFEGQRINDDEYTGAHPFWCGMGLVKKDGYFYFIKTDGTRLNDGQYSTFFGNELDMGVWNLLKKNGDIVDVDVNGKEIVERREDLDFD